MAATIGCNFADSRGNILVMADMLIKKSLLWQRRVSEFRDVDLLKGGDAGSEP